MNICCRAVLCLLVPLVLEYAACQDSGQAAARLAPLVNGTLPNAAAFASAAAQQPSGSAIAAGRLPAAAAVRHTGLLSPHLHAAVCMPGATFARRLRYNGLDIRRLLSTPT